MALKELENILPPKIFEETKEAAKGMGEKDKEKFFAKVLEVYNKSKFESGEAIGILAAQSVSEPATQMSLPYDEKILIKRGEILQPVEIGKFVDGIFAVRGFTKERQHEIYDIPVDENIFVYSLDEDEKLKLKKIKAAIRHTAPKKLLEIKTASGRRIVATDHHSFVTKLNGKIVPISGKLLKAGDKLPVTKLNPRYIFSEYKIKSQLGMKLALKFDLPPDIVWDEIEKISYIDCNDEYVYDISVDGLETFTTFDGIITHNTMRTYSMAGAAAVQVTLGLPRLVEIFDARKAPSTPTMTIYLKSSHNTREKAMKIASEIREVLLSDIISLATIDLLNQQIEVSLDKSKLRDTGAKESGLPEAVKEQMKAVGVQHRGDKIFIKPKSELTVKEMQKLRGKILDVHVKGVKSVSHAVVTQKENDWVITTLGSNLAKVLEADGVDSSRTTTNNIHEVERVLGIEAARTTIINEAMNTLKEQGLDVDVRHVMITADVMTVDGTIRAIGRYGVAGLKGSVLARANFEETIKHLTRAAVTAESDKLESIVENVMINQVVPVGTGMFELTFKMPSKKKAE